VKKVVNHARINMDPKSKRILELEEEILRLKGLLENCRCGGRSEETAELVEVPMRPLSWWQKLFGVRRTKKIQI
jgi:protein-arginine kinase